MQAHPWTKGNMMTSSYGNIFHITGLCEGNPPVTSGFPSSTGDQWIPLTKAYDTELWCFLWSVLEQTVEQTVEMPVILDANTLIMTSLWWLWNKYLKGMLLLSTIVSYMGALLNNESGLAQSLDLHYHANLWSGSHFTNDFSIVIQIRWIFHSDLIQVIMKWSLWKFAQDMTAVLSWHV